MAFAMNKIIIFMLATFLICDGRWVSPVLEKEMKEESRLMRPKLKRAKRLSSKPTLDESGVVFSFTGTEPLVNQLEQPNLHLQTAGWRPGRILDPNNLMPKSSPAQVKDNPDIKDVKLRSFTGTEPLVNQLEQPNPHLQTAGWRPGRILDPNNLMSKSSPAQVKDNPDIKDVKLQSLTGTDALVNRLQQPNIHLQTAGWRRGRILDPNNLMLKSSRAQVKDNPDIKDVKLRSFTGTEPLVNQLEQPNLHLQTAGWRPGWILDPNNLMPKSSPAQVKDNPDIKDVKLQSLTGTEPLVNRLQQPNLHLQTAGWRPGRILDPNNLMLKSSLAQVKDNPDIKDVKLRSFTGTEPLVNQLEQPNLHIQTAGWRPGRILDPNNLMPKSSPAQVKDNPDIKDVKLQRVEKKDHHFDASINLPYEKMIKKRGVPESKVKDRILPLGSRPLPVLFSSPEEYVKARVQAVLEEAKMVYRQKPVEKYVDPNRYAFTVIGECDGLILVKPLNPRNWFSGKEVDCCEYFE